MPSSEAPANGSQHLNTMIMNVYQNIINQKKRQHITETVLGDKLGISQSELSKSLKEKEFTLPQLFTIYETLHLKPEDMFKAAGVIGDAEKITEKITAASDKMSMKLDTHIRDLITYLLPPTNASAERED